MSRTTDAAIDAHNHREDAILQDLARSYNDSTHPLDSYFRGIAIGTGMHR